jgi:hypothetical protein
MMDAVDLVVTRQWEAVQRDAISHWTVFDHPRDFPDIFVARRCEVTRDNPDPVATDDIIGALSLDDLRDCLSQAGLVALMRSEDDDPKIVEVWI